MVNFVNATNVNVFKNNIRTMFHFYTPCERQKTSGFFMFSGGIKMERPSDVFIVYFECHLQISRLSFL